MVTICAFALALLTIIMIGYEEYRMAKSPTQYPLSLADLVDQDDDIDVTMTREIVEVVAQIAEFKTRWLNAAKAKETVLYGQKMEAALDQLFGMMFNKPVNVASMSNLHNPIQLNEPSNINNVGHHSNVVDFDKYR